MQTAPERQAGGAAAAASLNVDVGEIALLVAIGKKASHELAFTCEGVVVTGLAIGTTMEVEPWDQMSSLVAATGGTKFNAFATSKILSAGWLAPAPPNASALPAESTVAPLPRTDECARSKRLFDLDFVGVLRGADPKEGKSSISFADVTA